MDAVETIPVDIKIKISVRDALIGFEKEFIAYKMRTTSLRLINILFRLPFNFNGV